MTNTETETLIYETAAGFAKLFVDAFPPGFVQSAVHEQDVYIGKIVGLFEQALRELIPYKFPEGTEFESTEVLPVLEGKVVANTGREEV
jgi:hypothetical protein